MKVSASRPSGSGTGKACADKSGDVGAEPRPGGAESAVFADEDVGHDHVGGDDRSRVDQIEGIAARQQEAGMQILLGQDLEDHGDRDDRHGLRGQLAEVGAEDDVGDMRGNDGEAEAGRQRDAEEQLKAFGEMRPHSGVALPGVDLHSERKERRGGAQGRDHQRLPDEVEARDIFSGICGADQNGNHEAVGDGGDGEQRNRQRQRQARPGNRPKACPVERDDGAAPRRARLDGDREQIGQCRR